MTFNRINITQLADKYNLHYIYFDLLRQTTIERIIKNTPINTNKKELIDLLLANTKYLLENMIMENNKNENI